MRNYWFTADTHFYHTNVIKYANRFEFDCVSDMNSYLIYNWNQRIKYNDDVYFLGDFGLGNPRSLKIIFDELKGIKHLIIGNHDNSHILKFGWASVSPVLELRIHKYGIWLNHYAQLTWPGKHYGSYHLFGHSHGKIEGIGKSTDVGVDTRVSNFMNVNWHDRYTPYNLDEIIDIMKNKT